MEIFQSREAFINWVVDNYHDQVVNNAISAGLITSDIPRDELYYVLINALESGGINQVMYAIDVPLNLRNQPQGVQDQFARNVPRGKRKVDFPQIRYDLPGDDVVIDDEQDADDIDWQNGGSFDWNQFGDIFNTASNVFATIFGAVTGPGQQPPSNGNNNLPAPKPQADNTTMYIGIALVIGVVVLITVLASRK